MSNAMSRRERPVASPETSRLESALDQRVSGVSALEAMLACLRTPLVLLDQNLGIRFKNDSAGQLLKGAAGLEISSGRLVLRPREEHRRLLAVVRRIGALEARGRAIPARDLLFPLLEGTRPVSRCLQVSPLQPGMFLEGDAAAVALASVIDPADGGPSSGEWARAVLARTLGLTAAESRVALLAATDASSHEIAQCLGLSPHTIRDHLKHIYAKAGVRTRAGLASRVTRLVTFTPFTN